MIIETGNKGVLDENTIPLPGQGKFQQGRTQLLQGPDPVYRHYCAPLSVIDAVKTYCKGEPADSPFRFLPNQSGKAADSGNMTGGGNSHTRSRYVTATLILQNIYRYEELVIIVEGLPHSHKNNIAYPYPQVELNKHLLGDDLSRRQVPLETKASCLAEAAAPCAANLG